MHFTHGESRCDLVKPVETCVVKQKPSKSIEFEDVQTRMAC